MRMVLAIAALVSIAVGLIAVGRAWYERAPAADGQRTSSVTSGEPFSHEEIDVVGIRAADNHYPTSLTEVIEDRRRGLRVVSRGDGPNAAFGPRAIHPGFPRPDLKAPFPVI